MGVITLNKLLKGVIVLIKTLLGKKKCVMETKNNEQLTIIIDLLKAASDVPTASICYEEQQLIEINKNKMQKLLDTQYTNKQHLDKLIITILFAEVGYLSHTAVQLIFPVILTAIIGFIGILSAIQSYKLTNRSLQVEEQVKEYEIYNLLKIDNYSEAIEEILKINKKNIKYIDFYEWIMYYSTVTTSILTFEYLFFNKESSNKMCYSIEYVDKFVIYSAVGVFTLLLLKSILNKTLLKQIRSFK